MVITYAGGYCFKLSAGDTTVAVNPPSSRSAFKMAKFGADVVLIAKADPDWDGADTATHGDKAPFVIATPGSYEVGEVVVNGYASDGYQNTLYTVEMDGMKILLLGALASAKLPADVREDLDDVEIVFVPVGDGTLDPKDAHDLVTTLEPNIVIPYLVGDPKKRDDLKQFLKAEGAADVKPTDKLTVRAKEVAAMDGEVVLFQ